MHAVFSLLQMCSNKIHLWLSHQGKSLTSSLHKVKPVILLVPSFASTTLSSALSFFSSSSKVIHSKVQMCQQHVKDWLLCVCVCVCVWIWFDT